jgi:type IV pilus assembly protein PilC
MYWICSVLTRSGQEVRISLAGSRKDVLKDLDSKHLSLIEMTFDYKRFVFVTFPRRRLSIQSLAVFFEDFSNMLDTGLSVSQVLLILKETSKEEALNNVLLILEDELRQGKSFTEALSGSEVFPWIVSTTLSAGEKTGRLAESMNVLGKYFRSSYQVQAKIQQALIYPAIVFVLLLIVMFFISLKVIPQLKNLLPPEALRNQSTQWILVISSLLQQYIGFFIGFLGLAALGISFSYKKYRYRFQQGLYRLPILGGILKESALALYLLNLLVLLKSGVSLLKALEDLNVLGQTPVSNHFAACKEYVLGGASFWQAIEQDKFFPIIISSTLRRAEEMVKVEEYCFTLADFFNRQVSSKVDGLLHLVQPALLAVGGIFLVTIASGFLLPIYGSLTTIANGQ